MRLSLTPSVSTKDGTSNRNARLTNCLKESKKTGDKAVIRPGLGLNDTFSGIGNGLIPFDGRLLVIYGDTVSDTGLETLPWPLDSDPWDAGTTYDIGDTVWYGDVLWFSARNSNTGNTPGTGGYWNKSSSADTYDPFDSYDIGDPVVSEGTPYYSWSNGNTGNTPSSNPELWKTTPPGTDRYYGSGGGYDAAPVDSTGPTGASKEAALLSWYAERTARSCATSSASTGWSWLALPYGSVGSPGIGSSVVVQFTAWVNGLPRNCTNQVNAGLIDACELHRTA